MTFFSIKRSLLPIKTGLLSLFLVLLISFSVQADIKKRVLYLNSYEDGYAWSDTLLEGLRSVLEAAPYRVNLHVEYMDTKRYPDPELRPYLVDLYRYKYEGLDIDAIIVSDDYAFDFILAYRDMLFPGVPVVFCGVNDYQPSRIEGVEKITGMAESFSVVENVELALRLIPDAGRMVVVGDESFTGGATMSAIRQVAPLFEDRLEIEYWSDLAMEAAIEAVSRLPEDTFIFYVPYYEYLKGSFYSAEDILERICKNASVPVFTFWEFLMGSGAIGGQLTSGYRHGKMAGEMLLQVLEGTPAASIPVITEDPYILLFDYAAMKRWGMDMGLLPRGSIFINEPRHFYELNREVFWTLMVSMALLSLVLVFLVFNIVRRRVVEEKIRDQLSFLKILMNTIPIPIYFKDKGGRFLGCNNSFENWFGVQVRNIVDKGDAVLQGRHPVRLFDEVDEALLKEPGVRVYENRIHDASGIHRHVILTKATYLNARGEVLGLVGVINDVHGMKTAQENLRIAEERYRSIFENASKGIFIASPEGRLTHMNRAFAHILGYDTEDDALQKTGGLLEPHYVDPESRKVFWEILLAGREVTGFEVAFYTRGRKMRWASLSARAVYDADGRMVHVEGIGEDITKRRHAEMALMESRQRLWLVLDNIPQLVFWQDRELRIMGMNRSSAEFFGLENGPRVIGKTLYELLPDKEDAAMLMERGERAVLQQEPVYRFKCHIQDGRGRKIWLEINKVPLLGADGVASGVLTCAEDITRKVTLERQLLQSQKMEALGRLSGGIAHDFNNILTSIINSAELAMEDLEEGSMGRKDLERVLRAGERGSGMIKKILAFSRPGREEFQCVDLRSVVQEGLDLLRTSIPGHIRVKEEFCGEQPLSCMADPVQIHQVLMNLCTNALQAMGSHPGTLEVHLSSLTLGETEAHGAGLAPGFYVCLRVADNGPGIAAAVLDKIFDPFFTTREKGGGSGLGLSMVHGIVMNHGGSVQVSSIPFERTVFDVFLPLEKKGGTSPATCRESAVNGNERLLFVEDDPDQRETVPRILRNLGYRVVSVGTADEALFRMEATEKNFDLVLTDYDMPGTDGLRLAHRLESMSPDLPVILVTGGGMAETLQPRGNIRAVLSKPYSRDSLNRVIRSVLDAELC
ncbi:PAS domain S-box-containing protein [Desulfobotulus alkaliphilus]|uniref:histidine kinase n=1 Tax=Desulfobotulus alkaliphilus TaxID=622671 RepID=A0A562RFN2_9BACT|nr:ABC transporter substrate binding protein [Desulfobotulus alkaliphilus]TWI67226.1 PAS domain S-box-containing protein [Desulfobotulus alkaliphilus]